MKPKMLIEAAVAAIFLCLLSSGANAVVVNIDSRSDTGATFNFNAGTYTISYIGTADGGSYNAWNAWPGAPGSGCTESGTNCKDGGWMNDFVLEIGPHTDSLENDTGFTNPFAPFANALQSLAAYQAGAPIQFTLASQMNVRFWILDHPYDDNTGGVSLRVELSEVPLPAALPLFATGLGVLGLVGWRRKRKAAAALSA